MASDNSQKDWANIGKFAPSRFVTLKVFRFMDHAPLVSIITIVYNGEKHIEHTIQSVLGQSYHPIEYIVIDGGSTDNTAGILEKYKDSIAVRISEKDQGISDAFNKGLKRATGEIIGIINSDDWYEKDAVEKAVAYIGNYDIVYGDLRLWKDGKPEFEQKGDDTHLENEMSVNHPTVFVRKNCYDRVGNFDKRYKCAMDYDLILRLRVNNYRFGYIPQVLANMRWEGISDTRWLLGCQETLLIKNHYLPDKKWSNQLYFYKHVLAIAATKFMQKIKLGFLVRIYRSRWARLKKVYE